MPQTPTYPGVYIEEVASGVRTITGVATAITAFVGFADKYALNAPRRVFSLAEYEKHFGDVRLGNVLSVAVRQFFRNGGSDAYVVNAGGGEKAKGSLTNGKDASAVEVLRLEAVAPGEWGNELKVHVEDYASSSDPGNLFNITVWDGTTEREAFNDLSMESGSPRYVETVLEQSRLVRGKRGDGETLKKLLQRGTSTSGEFDEKDVGKIEDAKKDEVGASLLAIQVDREAVKEIDILAADDDFIVTKDGVRKLKGDKIGEKIASLCGAIKSLLKDTVECKPNQTNGKWTITIESKADITNFEKGEHSSVRILAPRNAADRKRNAAKHLKLGAFHGGTEASAASHLRPTVNTQNPEVTLADGKDAEPSGDPQALFDGLSALEKIDLFNLLVIPGTYDLPTTVARKLLAAARELCERKRAFLLADLPKEIQADDVVEVGNRIGAILADLGKQGAAYYPHISDPHPGATAATIAGIFARTDKERGVWKAPAGIDAVLRDVQQLNVSLTDQENGVLNPKGINALRTFPTFGNVVWGARTGEGAEGKPLDWRYVPVRRTTLFIEESLYRGTQWVVFEPNDDPLWAAIRMNVGAFMQGLFRQGAFQGKTARDAYFVKCDAETTTPDDVNKGKVNILVGFAPLKPAEFVIISLQQMASPVGAQ